MITCPEYSFIQFNDNLDDCCCTIPLEVAESSDLSFYLDIPVTYQELDISLEDGAIIYGFGKDTFVDAEGYKRTSTLQPGIIVYDKSKQYYYSGNIAQNYPKPIFAVGYYDGSMGHLGNYPIRSYGAYQRLKLNIPDSCIYIVACSYKSNPVIEVSPNPPVYICNLSGEVLGLYGSLVDGWLVADVILSDILACYDCFRLMIIDNNVKYYSNVFQYNSHTSHPLVQFRSRNEAFFKYSENNFWSCRLPIELLSRNPKTETEEYIDANGWIHNPYKLRRDIYDLNVNYSPVGFHKKIQVMLMHNVTIDDIPVNETGDYQVDYEESVFENGTSLYRASTEVSEQDILLMRNY